MVYHTYKITIKSDVNSDQNLEYLMENTTVTFATFFHKVIHDKNRDTGRIEFSNGNFLAQEITDLHNLYSFFETAIAASQNTDNFLVQFEEFDNEIEDYIVLMSFLPLDSISLSYTNNQLENNKTRMGLTLVLLSNPQDHLCDNNE